MSEDESGSVTNDHSGMTDNPDGAVMAKKYNTKNPDRPRRKKARRACFACQRAHLTCGDERPCERCVKRGLADGCQDGVRKKAKYLHNAPPEALGPVLGPNHDPKKAEKGRPQAQRQNSAQSEDTITTKPSAGFYPQAGIQFNPRFGPASQASVNLPEPLSFPAQSSPISPLFQTSGTYPPLGTMLPTAPIDFNTLFDPSKPALPTFDLEGLNFGSQYGGWEFGVLNKMTLGGDTPLRNSLSQTPTRESNNYSAFFNNGSAPTFDGTGGSGLVGADYAEIKQETSNVYSQGNLQYGPMRTCAPSRPYPRVSRVPAPRQRPAPSLFLV